MATQTFIRLGTNFSINLVREISLEKWAYLFDLEVAIAFFLLNF